MNRMQYPSDWPDIDQALYGHSVKLINAAINLLGVKLRLHAEESALMQGDIFLFNHFSRFETFIPQLLIHEHVGALTCAIASGEFFAEDTVLARYLKRVGVYPHDHPRLFPLLARQILKGRKVVIFPEGGMVKDRRVIDKQGRYSIYSRMTGDRRKHHTGPAVLAQGVETIKTVIRQAFARNDQAEQERWRQWLAMDSLDELRAVAQKPTLIVPANITFYPIRNSENLLFKSVELFSHHMSLRQQEELLIEGNILLKDTDMDIRLGKLIDPCCVWDWRMHCLMGRVVPTIQDADQVFNFHRSPRNWKERLLGRYFIRNANCSRDRYMVAIYRNATVNLAHLASTLIMRYIGEGRAHIEKRHFYTVLYIAIKHLQNQPDIYLHDSLLSPADYANLLHNQNARFNQFIEQAQASGLLLEQEGYLHFLPKLLEDHDFDRVRLENPIAVYQNEVAPLSKIRDTLAQADAQYHDLEAQQMAAWLFEDEQIALKHEVQCYSQAHFDSLDQQETACADPAPFFISPVNSNEYGILLVHGLIASPAELREYGHYLAEQGYTVLGIRLPGHGTSPYALRDFSCEDWLDSVKRGYNILKYSCDKIFLIGFSTGAALAMTFAARQHIDVQGIVAVAVPIKFEDNRFMLVPLLHGTNKLVKWLSSFEGVKPFLQHDSEHPDINYKNVPVRALYELRRLIQQLEAALPGVSAPTLLLHANQDPVVDPVSSAIVYKRLGARYKQLLSIRAERHGALMENLDHTWSRIDEFLSRCRHSQLASAALASPEYEENLS
ncbi:MULTISPECIES: alpha/beta fold hydrolase [Methylomonas]|uniref:alpha/beta fold hydrolase n=1 Tax=Methylomonas TaxID=416 RepID=UPI001231B159|nr:alpha/beta fold hydrolase [Methylomonas rhizoryzae]